jgi:hypothetical protein
VASRKQKKKDKINLTRFEKAAVVSQETLINCLLVDRISLQNVYVLSAGWGVDRRRLSYAVLRHHFQKGVDR